MASYVLQTIECATQSVNWTTEVGRLDFLSVTLSIISVVLVLGGIFGFININSKAKKIAAEIAEETAKKQAEYHTNAYIQRNLFAIITSYQGFTNNPVPPSSADRIAESQNDDN